MRITNFILLCVVFAPLAGLGVGSTPNCSNAKTPDDCATCCSQIVGENRKKSPLAVGCANFVSAGRVGPAKKEEVISDLEVQTGIKADSLKAICTPENRGPQNEGPIRRLAASESANQTHPQNTSGNSVPTGSTASMTGYSPEECLKACRNLPKKKVGK